jgi:hypothetical protein
VLEPPRKAINFRRLWEGPLLALRISPKWSLGDALQNATVKRSNPSFSSAFRGSRKSNHVRWRSSVKEQRPHARSTSQGDVTGRAGSNFEQRLGHGPDRQ